MRSSSRTDRIDAAADHLARAGFNLVRFHHLDGPQGLLPAERAGQTPRIDPQKLEALDYWVAALRQRGIYVYLDLLSYRTFYPEEGVEGADRLRPQSEGLRGLRRAADGAAAPVRARAPGRSCQPIH